VRLEELGQLKNPMTSYGVEFPTFWFADAASFKYSADHCTLTPLHVSIMISKDCYQIFRPKI
jgi:hypothetical protein